MSCFLRLTLVCALSFALGSCSADPSLTAVDIVPANQTLGVGQTVQFKANGRFIKRNQSVSVSDITSTVTWQSSNPAIATVNASGLGTAVSAGTTTITASGSGGFAGVTGTATITVTAAAGSAARDLVSITLIPGNSTVQGAGATTQFQAFGNYSSAPLTQNLTSTATWVSSNVQVGTINSTGLATAVSSGSTTITASAAPVSGGVVTATGSMTVSGAAVVTRDLTGITIIPSSQSVQNIGEAVQFLAIGSFSASPTTEEITNQVTWSSSDTRIATVDATGVASATGGGSATIVARLTAPVSQSLITATATLINPNSGSVVLPQLTVYKLNDSSFGIVTNSTGPISCGPTCTGGFPSGTVVTLTASPAAGHNFVGWSTNCNAVGPVCTITMSKNQTVAATFN